MTDVVLADSPGVDVLADSMRWADILARSDLAPKEYRGRPANIVLAHSLGRNMGLDAAQSMLRIHVIQGRPVASSELILANVRLAGHRVRFMPHADGQGVTCVIIRADDPEWEHKWAFTMDDAKALGLLTRQSWREQSRTMLHWRSLAQCARYACPEALYGVTHLADELESVHTVHTYATGDTEPLSRETFTAARVETPQAGEKANAPDPGPEEIPENSDDETAPLPDPITAAQRATMFGLYKRKGIDTKAAQLAGVNDLLGLAGDARITSRGALSFAQAARVIEALDGLPDAEPNRD